MIDLYNGELVNMLPYSMASGIEQQCISYALKAVTRNVIDLAKTTRTQAVIDELPEQILDLLASELRAPYYVDTMDVDTKRDLIKHVITWHFQAGTPGSIKEFLSNVVGTNCELEEWFEYDGTPGTFRVNVDITNSSEENPEEEQDLDDLKIKVLRMKRFSAWLESFSYMIKHGLQIGEKVEKWAYNVPVCGTIYCGTYWTPSTLGYTEGDGIEIAAITDGFVYTSDFCGTLPNVSTIGYSLSGEEVVDGDAAGFVYTSNFCGLRRCGGQ